MRTVRKVLVLAALAAHLAAAPLTYSGTAYAQSSVAALPAPYVSRAFDAVLLPINAAVRSAFDFNSAIEGVLVLAVEPGGVADSQGIEPGDVISEVKGRRIIDPIELDEVVYYWIINGLTDFGFTYYRGGTLQTIDLIITLEEWETVIDVTTISTWEAWEVSSFSYSEYYEEYYEELIESYESSEMTIEETVTSEEFSEEVTAESEAAEDEELTDDSINDAVDDSAEDDGDITDDGDMGDDSADESVDDDGGDDEIDDGGDDDGGGDEGDE